MSKFCSTLTLVVSLCLLCIDWALATESLKLATTTSTENSGLLEILNPPFESKTGIRVDVIAVGTGKAIHLAENGDVDLILVHAPEAEQVFVNAGFGVERHAVMHNDFIVLGPSQDPAGLKDTESVEEAFGKIGSTQSPFVSRGDDSGTHKKEVALWKLAAHAPAGSWYISAGQGMGAVLRIADDKGAYTLADRGTYLAFRDKISLRPMFEGVTDLYNPYHIIAVNPQVHSHVNHEGALRYIEYLTGPEGQGIIAGYRKHGQQLFHPDVIFAK